jgi:beta-galactosidase
LDQRKNVIAVKVSNERQPNSRWYSGSGIYRNVWLVTTNGVFVDHWGTYVTTTEITKTSATVKVNLTIKNSIDKSRNVSIDTKIYDAQSNLVSPHRTASGISVVSSGANLVNIGSYIISNPHLWSIEDPYLYKALTSVYIDGKNC